MTTAASGVSARPPRPVPLALCIDLEQDDISSTAASMHHWEGARTALEWARSLPWREPAVINWFVRTDVQTSTELGAATWPLRHLEAGLRRAVDRGDSVGAHPHLYRRTPGGWRNDWADPEYAWQCAQVALAAHTEVFGEPCRTWRWGDRVGQPQFASLLAQAGVLVDVTAEPGRAAMGPRDGGAGLSPSYACRDAQPRVVDGVVDWPLSTCTLAEATLPAGGERALVSVGSFDAITDHWLHGWCADATAGRENEVVDVELLVDGAVAAVTAADWYRADVAAAGYGTGHHGVRIDMRDHWRSLPAAAFTMRAAGHTTALTMPPSDSRTARGGECTVIPLPWETEPEQFDRLLTTVLRTRPPHITIALRSDRFLDSASVAALDHNCATLAALSDRGVLSPPQSLVALAMPLVEPACR